MHFHSSNRGVKLLILYASYGDGHYQAAKAIRDACQSNGSHEAVLYDLMAESHPWLNEMTRRFYIRSYTHMPFLYGWMYDLTRPMKHDSLFGNWLHSFGRQKITQIMNREKPDAVVYTFPFYALRTNDIRKNPRIPSYTVITDFDLHRRWIHPDIDRYYVATQDLSSELCRHGIRSHQVQATGIPLKKGFETTPVTEELYAKYGLLPHLPTILIMAGAQGVLPNVTQICKRLLQESPVQIVLVCGRNRQLKESILNRFASADLTSVSSRLHPFGFVEEIHELMSLADCLITKPGGITLAEAIAAELPTFIYRPVPGQERHNALYLQSKGAAFVASRINPLIEGLLQLVNDPLRLDDCRKQIRQLQAAPPYGPAGSAEQIVEDILSSLSLSRQASRL
ncbi:glycosyltransferase [Paenibacillus sp. GCM10027627]|uniref:MGDG synthase family glycosyltransferase n=1 Tax=unclassified Paenibacillus TaxID=185978 RepID=UPI00363C15F1